MRKEVQKAYPCVLSCSVVSDSCDPMDCSPPGSSVYEIFQARIRSGLPFPIPRGLPDPGIEPVSPTLAGGFSITCSHLGNPRVTCKRICRQQGAELEFYSREACLYRLWFASLLQSLWKSQMLTFIPNSAFRELTPVVQWHLCEEEKQTSLQVWVSCVSDGITGAWTMSAFFKWAAVAFFYSKVHTSACLVKPHASLFSSWGLGLITAWLP